MKRSTILLFLVMLLTACQRQQPTVPLWATEEEVGDAFDLSQIEMSGELIALTLSGPDTYYDYQGSHLGVQYLLCQQFAQSLGVRLRMEVCRDTAEVLKTLEAGDADLAALQFTTDSLSPGWLVGHDKPELSEALAEWYRPGMLAEAQAQERQMLRRPRVSHRVYAPMLSRGVISHYDEYFKKYGKGINWDWRLLAAQCYQESTFDPEAQSWAGARGLMQIMPRTADHLGLARDQMNDPEQNIAAATRYLKELEGQFRYIRDRQERQNMVLASYNGGIHHVRDAMRLAERDKRNPQRWQDVRPYILRLSQPEYYKDSLVLYGYMRGSETADYVDKIRKRYDKYKRSVR